MLSASSLSIIQTQLGAGRGDIDGAKLLAGVCDLRRLTYAKMKECIDAQPKDGTTTMAVLNSIRLKCKLH